MLVRYNTDNIRSHEDLNRAYKFLIAERSALKSLLEQKKAGLSTLEQEEVKSILTSLEKSIESQAQILRSLTTLLYEKKPMEDMIAQLNNCQNAIEAFMQAYQSAWGWHDLKSPSNMRKAHIVEEANAALNVKVQHSPPAKTLLEDDELESKIRAEEARRKEQEKVQLRREEQEKAKERRTQQEEDTRADLRKEKEEQLARKQWLAEEHTKHIADRMKRTTSQAAFEKKEHQQFATMKQAIDEDPQFQIIETFKTDINAYINQKLLLGRKPAHAQQATQIMNYLVTHKTDKITPEFITYLQNINPKTGGVNAAIENFIAKAKAGGFYEEPKQKTGLDKGK